jgi:geranylgeranyl diphosphate synthase type I
MSLDKLLPIMLPAVEDELQKIVAHTNQPGLEGLYSMLAYHLGWEGEDAGPEARGKRIRPLLVLLSTSAAGGEWRCALPAAVAVELVHNFSLVHDDIQDQSPLRRGRTTLWTKCGIAQALNAGDTLFSLAFISLASLEQTVSASVALKAGRILSETCMALTQGQYLDLAYEARGDLTLDAYWPMVNGKTSALLSACTQIGALAADAPQGICDAYRRFGHLLGLAFQAQDDLLGIWGDAALTGKSIDSDLLTGKKTLPVLYGLAQNGLFAQRWLNRPFKAEEIAPLAAQLEAEGGRSYTQERTTNLTEQALQALAEAGPVGEAGEALVSLAKRLVSRRA